MQTSPASSCSPASSLAETDAASFAQHYWNNSRKAMEILAASPLSNIIKPQIKTIVTYYHRLYQGGTENVMRALAGLWSEAGYRVVVVVDEGSFLDEALLPPAVAVRAIPVVPDNEPDRFPERINALTTILEEHEADALVYHAWNSGWLPWDMTASKKAGCPFVIACSSVFSLRAIEGDPYFSVQPTSFAAADGVACLSEADEAFWGSFNGNTHRVLNPVDPSLYEAPASALDGHTLVWAGRFSSEKRPEDAISILAKVRERIPDARLTLLGTGESIEYDQRLQAMAEELGVGDAVDFCGFVDNVADYYRASDLALVTSEYEGFHLALFEMLAHGVPAITYDLPNLSWIQGTEGVTIVPQQAIDQAAETAVALFESRDGLKRAGDAARAHIRAFAAVDILAQWEQIFESLGHPKPEPATTPGQETMWKVLLSSYAHGIDGINERLWGKITSLWQQIDSERARANAELEQAQAQISHLEEERDLLARSWSFRVGSAVTLFPRKARTAWRVLRVQGMGGILRVCREKLHRSND